MPFVEIKDISNSVELLQSLGELAKSKFDYYLLLLLGLILNYFYYYLYLPTI